MPCTQTGSLIGDQLESRQAEIDARERMLCAICTFLEVEFTEEGAKDMLRAAAMEHKDLKKKDITRWWKQHKKAEGKA